MEELISGEVVTELMKQLFAISNKAFKCRGVAENLATMIEDYQPLIKDILYSGVEVSSHRQVQLRMFSETLEKCRKLTEKILKCHRWDKVRQLYYTKKMEDLESKISRFLKGVSFHILDDIHHHRVDNEVRFDRIDRNFDSLREQLGDIHHHRVDNEFRFDRIERNFGSLREQLGEIHHHRVDTEVQLNRIDRNFDSLREQLGEVHHHRVDNEFRFDRIERNFGSLREQLGEIHHHRVDTEVQLNRIDRNFDSLREQLGEVHHHRVDTEVRFDRIDGNFDSLREHIGSMKIRGGELAREAMKTVEATMDLVTNGNLGNLGVGLDLGKKKVKEMMFNPTDEARLIGISGMSGSGKTTLARELERDKEVRGHFENQVLFLTVSQSPDIKELKALIWSFLTGSGASLPEQIGQTRKLVILDDVWTRESLDNLVFNCIPNTTTLVVSRSRLAGPKSTYDVELLNEDEATSLFCLSAFDQKSVLKGFSESLVKQLVEECKGLPLALKVVGASLKDQPEKYWEAAAKRLSKGEPANDTHESRVFAQIEASLETLDPKTRECFLDMAAFPEDKKIPLDVIINIWVELHYLDEETAFGLLIDLSNKNLLTLVKDPRLGTQYTSYYDIFVTQHDVLRDVALHLSNRGKVNSRERLFMPKRESVLPREWEMSNEELYNARIVSLHTGEMTETDWFDMEFSKAEVLILNFSADNYVLPPFIAKMGRLRALVIINNGMSTARLHDLFIFTNLANLRSLWLKRIHIPELSNNTVPLKKLHKMCLVLCKINTSFDQTTLDMTKIFPSLSDLTIDYCDDLVKLPSTICGITSLNSISITNCPRINELPANLSKLKDVQLLRLYACLELKSLPEEICELPSLKYLDISQCVSLSSLPKEIGKLRKLEKVDMRECGVTSIPSSAVSLTSLRHVICDKETLRMWEDVEKVVPRLRVEAAEKCFTLDWLDE